MNFCPWGTKVQKRSKRLGSLSSLCISMYSQLAVLASIVTDYFIASNQLILIHNVGKESSLEFVVYMTHYCANKWGVFPAAVYQLLNEAWCIISHYYAQSSEYVFNDIEIYLRAGGGWTMILSLLCIAIKYSHILQLLCIIRGINLYRLINKRSSFKILI